MARYDQDFTPPDRMSSDADTQILYNFDEGTGEVVGDMSGHRQHGKIVGAKWVKRMPSVATSPEARARLRHRIMLWPSMAKLLVKVPSLKSGSHEAVHHRSLDDTPKQPFQTAAALSF